MKKIAALVVGAVLVVLALVYGFSGMLVPSIQERGDHIARWEGEIARDKQRVEAALVEAEALGKQPATAGERSPFEHKLDAIDQMNRNLRSTADLIDHERDRRKEMILITAALAAAGVIALLIGLRLRR